LTFRVRNSMH